MSDKYIFGYLSLLSSSSTKATIGTENPTTPKFIPVVLNGYKRTWDSCRKSINEKFKRYVYSDSLKTVDYFCWATLRRDPESTVNGVMFKVDDRDIEAFDFREGGYRRVEITENIKTYPGSRIGGDSYNVYTYISNVSHDEDVKRAIISMDYINMGIKGAIQLDEKYPGFYGNYINGTAALPCVIGDIKQMYLDQSGSLLFMLNEKDSSVILVHEFTRPLYSEIIVRDDLNRPISYSSKNLDHRNILGGKSGDLSMAATVTDPGTQMKLFNDGDIWIHIALCKNKTLCKSVIDAMVIKNHWLTSSIINDVHSLSLRSNDPWVQRISA